MIGFDFKRGCSGGKVSRGVDRYMARGGVTRTKGAVITHDIMLSNVDHIQPHPVAHYCYKRERNVFRSRTARETARKKRFDEIPPRDMTRSFFFFVFLLPIALTYRDTHGNKTQVASNARAPLKNSLSFASDTYIVGKKSATLSC